MTAVPSFAFNDMDASNLDDKMDVASSPYRQPDDLDVDLDSIHDPSVIGSLQDEMADDPAMTVDSGLQAMQNPTDDTLADDDMLDDTEQYVSAEHPDTDFNMDGFNEELQGDEDDDILYEDEEETRPDTSQNNGAVEDNNHHELLADINETAPEITLDDFEYQPEYNESNDLTTNEPEILPTDTGAPTGDQMPENNDIPLTQQHESSGITEPNLEAELEEPLLHEDQAGTDAEQPEVGEYPEQTEPSLEDTRDAHESEETKAIVEATEPTGPTVTGTLEEEHHDDAAESHENNDTIKSVHPVTLSYLDEDMSLFPPMLGDASSVYFLSDSSLAFEPLDQLLAACREVLTGTLDHHDELVLDVPGLGLHICEDSKYATQITLAEILDVYLHLCRNGAVQEARPLYCHLSSRVSLASQYSYLASVGREGKTYAEIAADHIDSPEYEAEDAGAETPLGQAQGSSLPSGAPASAVGESVVVKQSADSAGDGHSPEISSPEKQGENEVHEEATTNAVASYGTGSTDTSRADVTESNTQAPGEFDVHEQDNAEDIEQEDIFDETHTRGEIEAAKQEQDTGVAAQAEDGHEHETNSSHTVEGDRVHEALKSDAVEDYTAEDGELDQCDVLEENNFQTAATEDIQDPQAVLEASGVEDLFTPQAEEIEDVQQDSSATLAENQTSLLQHASEQNLFEEGTSFTSQDKLEPAVATDPAGNLSPPMTPPSSKQVKRKADDEDDLLFLDLDTPDPKRRRPS